MEDFELTLEGDGITVKRSVDRATALAILNSVLSPQRPEAASDLGSGGALFAEPQAAVEQAPGVGAAKIAPRLPAPATGTSTPNDKPTSLREYVNRFEPKTNAQIILCIAQFLAEHESLDRFQRDEIKPKFPAAGEPLPKNYSRDFQTAMDKGWIGADPMNSSLFFVTRTGEQQLAKGFKGRRN